MDRTTNVNAHGRFSRDKIINKRSPENAKRPGRGQASAGLLGEKETFEKHLGRGDRSGALGPDEAWLLETEMETGTWWL